MASGSRVSESRGFDGQPHTVTSPNSTRRSQGDRELIHRLGLVVLLIASSGWFGGAGKARAFSDPSLYGKYPSEQLGGGGGRYFTGSPADGYGCSVCHTAPVDYHWPLYQSGLPVDGYIPGNPYTVRLQWPEAAAWAQQSGSPMTSLTAEFVAEDGGPAGTLENVALVLHRTSELCTSGDTTLFAHSIMQLAEGVDPVAEPLDPDGQQPCVADGEGKRRCVLTVRPCGSSEVQVRWRAPEQWGGPIWFSAGFVVTDRASSQPNDNDYVTELSIPINPIADGATYETTLSGGCSVSNQLGRSPRTPLAWLALLSIAALAWRRARRHHGQRAAAVVSALVVASFVVGCSQDSDSDLDRVRSDSTIGLFEPGPRIDAGATKQTYKCPFDTVPGIAVDMDAGAGAASTGTGAGASAAGKPISGTLAISFMTTPPPGGVGNWDGKDGPGTTPNYGVVWIEDPARHYVKTLALWGKDYLVTTLTTYVLNTRAGCADDTTDVVSSATIYSHVAHSLTWSGANIDGEIVPRGKYVLWLELETQENPHFPATQVPLEIGDQPWTMQVPSQPIHKDLTITYTPKR